MRPKKICVPKILGLKKFELQKSYVQKKFWSKKVGWCIPEKNIPNPNPNQTEPNCQKYQGMSDFCMSGLYATFQIPRLCQSGVLSYPVCWVVYTYKIRPLRGPTCMLEPARSKQSWIPSWARVWQYG